MHLTFDRSDLNLISSKLMFSAILFNRLIKLSRRFSKETKSRNRHFPRELITGIHSGSQNLVPVFGVSGTARINSFHGHQNRTKEIPNFEFRQKTVAD